jgi:hypothetical protein
MPFAVGVAPAKEVCYKLGDFVDILRLEVGRPTSGAAPHTLVYGNWFADTTPSGNYPIYSVPVSGSMEFDFGTTKVKRLSLHGTNTSYCIGKTPKQSFVGPTYLGGNPICALDGIPGSAFVIDCVGNADPKLPPFHVVSYGIKKKDQLTLVGCAAQLPSSATNGPAGRAIGAP